MRKKFPKWLVAILAFISAVILPLVLFWIIALYIFPDYLLSEPSTSVQVNTSSIDWWLLLLYVVWPVSIILLTILFYKIIKKGGILAIIIVSLGLFFFFLISSEIIFAILNSGYHPA